MAIKDGKLVIPSRKEIEKAIKHVSTRQTYRYSPKVGKYGVRLFCNMDKAVDAVIRVFEKANDTNSRNRDSANPSTENGNHVADQSRDAEIPGGDEDLSPYGGRWHPTRL